MGKTQLEKQHCLSSNLVAFFWLFVWSQNAILITYNHCVDYDEFVIFWLMEWLQTFSYI